MSESCKLKLFRQAVLRSAGCHRSVEKKNDNNNNNYCNNTCNTYVKSSSGEKILIFFLSTVHITITFY